MSHKLATVLLFALGGCTPLKPGSDREDAGQGCVGARCAAILQLAAGGSDHTCALRSDGSVWCWGRNQNGELGLGSTANTPAPTQVTDVARVSDFSVGDRFTCVARASGAGFVSNTETWCWGANDLGQLGSGDTVERLRPALSFTYLDHVTTKAAETKYIRSGASHACARADDETVYCWGDDSTGALGGSIVSATTCGSVPCQTNPMVVQQGGANALSLVIDVSAGLGHSCALQHGDVYCWGGNRFGESGMDPPDSAPHPVPFAIGLSGFVEIALGGSSSCGVDTSGGAWCWGDNRAGQLGIGVADSSGHANAVQPIGLASGVVDFWIGPGHACARTLDNALWCWGKNDRGQLGNGTTIDRAAPVQVMSDIVEAAIGRAHTCARKHDLTLWCWGDNSVGQLGLGTADGDPHPTAMLLSGLP